MMNEKELIQEVIMKKIKNEITLIPTFHGEAIRQVWYYIQHAFNDIFDKIASYENRYDGIIRIKKKKEEFDNETEIDDFLTLEEYDFEGNIRKIVKDEIDEHFIEYCEKVSDKIRKHEIEKYIAGCMGYEPQSINRIIRVECPTNMSYDEEPEDMYSCGGDISYRLRRRVLQNIRDL